MYRYLAFLLFCCGNVSSHFLSSCEPEISESYLKLASDLVEKSNRPTRSGGNNSFTPKPVDCADVLLNGNSKSGLYTIWPMSRLTDSEPLAVYCDMDTDGGGWTVVQRRGNFGRSEDYFFQDWQSYKKGFGDTDEDFWLGNDNIFALTNQRLYSVRFDLQDTELEKRYALYDSFWIDDEYDNYTLHISGYRGDAGDAMLVHDSQKFSTKDRDNDQYGGHCAEKWKGGWWYNDCHDSNLNGLYRSGVQKRPSTWVSWYPWKGDKESLESTEIKIRPRDHQGVHSLSVTSNF